jgi:serine-type D-Ala-D-Ala carboxypeptidase/endopeptidase (penicillin-binding protein 4)
LSTYSLFHLAPIDVYNNEVFQEESVLQLLTLVNIFLTLSLHANDIKYEMEIVKDFFPEDQIGYSVIELDTGKVVKSHNMDKVFVPASVSKVPTIIFALENLGADFRFVTSLKYSGDIVAGVIKGNLYLEGKGDPTLIDADLMNMALALKSMGINKVEGSFVYNDDYLIPHSAIAHIGPNHQTYNPGVSALSSEFNQFEIYRAGNSPQTYKNDFAVVPSISNVKIEQVSERFRDGRRFDLALNTQGESWKMSKYTNYRKIESLPVRNPSVMTAERFKFMADHLQIKLPTPIYGKTDTGAKEVHTHKSKALLDIASETLEYSNNLYAELILLTTVREMKGIPLSIEDSGLEMLGWFKKNYPQVSWEGIVLDNGSGLSINSRHTPQNMSNLLRAVSSKKFGSDHLWSILSISGKSGWLSKRLRDPDLIYKVWAKTGSMDYASNLAGYLISNSKKRFAFSLYFTDLDKRMKLDEKVDSSSHELRRKAPLWMSKSKKAQDEILALWVRTL